MKNKIITYNQLKEKYPCFPEIISGKQIIGKTLKKQFVKGYYRKAIVVNVYSDNTISVTTLEFDDEGRFICSTKVKNNMSIFYLLNIIDMIKNMFPEIKKRYRDMNIDYSMFQSEQCEIDEYLRLKAKYDGVV
jgi:hypothetical protein